EEVPRNAAVDDRLRRAPKGVIPQRGQVPAEDRVRLFLAIAERVFATTARVASASEVPAAVADYLRARNLPATVRMGDDPRLDSLPWSDTALDVSRGATGGNDPVALSRAVAGV